MANRGADPSGRPAPGGAPQIADRRKLACLLDDDAWKARCNRPSVELRADRTGKPSV